MSLFRARRPRQFSHQYRYAKVHRTIIRDDERRESVGRLFWMNVFLLALILFVLFAMLFLR